MLITKPDPQTNEAIMVNVTTQRPHSETTVILKPGDHPFVQKPSVIFYADARKVDVQLLDEALRRGSFRAHATFQSAVLKRIQDGLLQSSLTPKKIKDAYVAALAAGQA